MDAWRSEVVEGRVYTYLGRYIDTIYMLVMLVLDDKRGNLIII